MITVSHYKNFNSYLTDYDGIFTLINSLFYLFIATLYSAYKMINENLVVYIFGVIFLMFK